MAVGFRQNISSRVVFLTSFSGCMAENRQQFEFFGAQMRLNVADPDSMHSKIDDEVSYVNRLLLFELCRRQQTMAKLSLSSVGEPVPLIRMHERLLKGHANNLSPLSDAKFSEELLQGGLDGPFRALQLERNLLVGPAFGDARQDRSLPCSEGYGAVRSVVLLMRAVYDAHRM